MSRSKKAEKKPRWRQEKDFDELEQYDVDEFCVKSRKVDQVAEYALFPTDKRRLFLSVFEVKKLINYLKNDVRTKTLGDEGLYDVAKNFEKEVKSLKLKAPFKKEGVPELSEELLIFWVELYIFWEGNFETREKYLSYRSTKKHLKNRASSPKTSKNKSASSEKKSRIDFEHFRLYCHGSENTSTITFSDKRSKSWNLNKIKDLLTYVKKHSVYVPQRVLELSTEITSILAAIDNEKYNRKRHIKVWCLFFKIKTDYPDFLESFRDWHRKRVSRNLRQ